MATDGESPKGKGRMVTDSESTKAKGRAIFDTMVGVVSKGKDTMFFTSRRATSKVRGVVRFATYLQQSARNLRADPQSKQINEAEQDKDDAQANAAGLRADLVMTYPIEDLDELERDAAEGEPRDGGWQRALQVMRRVKVRRTITQAEKDALDCRLKGRTRAIVALRRAGRNARRLHNSWEPQSVICSRHRTPQPRRALAVNVCEGGRN